MNLIINTDGASRGNPGLAAYAFVLKEKEGQIGQRQCKNTRRVSTIRMSNNLQNQKSRDNTHPFTY